MIYFIRNIETGEIKIGVGVRPRSRLKQLQTGSSATLELMGAIPGGIWEERELHRKWQRYRVRGEWFEPNAELLSEIWKMIGKSGVIRCANVPAVR
jgi:hypothetical protein